MDDGTESTTKLSEFSYRKHTDAGDHHFRETDERTNAADNENGEILSSTGQATGGKKSKDSKKSEKHNKSRHIKEEKMGKDTLKDCKFTPENNKADSFLNDPSRSTEASKPPESPFTAQSRGEQSITKMVTTMMPAAIISAPQPPKLQQQKQQQKHKQEQRKLKSYSQPLPRSEIPRCRSNLKKKHSLDEDHPHSSLDHPYSFSSCSSLPSDPIPEFIGAGGATGSFRLPPRAAIHPGRPPPIEIRPRPLRESQTGSFLRSIACTSSHLWAAQDCGVRFWYLSEIFVGWEGRQKPRIGDEESAPFRMSVHTASALCLVVDAGRGLVWSGHSDGKIRSWTMEQPTKHQMGSSPVNNLKEGGSVFKEGLSWQAHRGAVLSMVMTSYGEIWSGSEGGNIRAWPWQAVKNPSHYQWKKEMAELVVERSCIDLRSLVTIEGECPLSGSNVTHLLSDNSSAKVWSGSSLSFALWDSRKKELLRVFDINGQVKAQSDTWSPQDPNVEDELKAKVSCSSKKEKSQGFLQRSRNAIMGAADAVCRVAGKGAFGDDNKRTEAMTISLDGIIWTGYTNGLLVQWDGNGNKLREIQHHSAAITCLCTFGSRLWVGYANGTVQVLDLEGYLIGGWVAHNSPVIKMAIGGLFLFTLANHGGIRAWYLASPGPLDNVLQSQLASDEMKYTKYENIKILAGTWNVGQGRASHESLIIWLGSAASEVGVVVIGLQEVEMGAGFLAVSAAKESVGLEGSCNGQWWLDNVGKVLDEGTSFERICSRQLAGLLVAVWARKDLKPYVGDVDASAVPCGLGRAIGNKGAVGLRMRVHDRIMCFVNCHFAAHLEAVNRRNADFNHVYQSMVFIRPPSGGNASTASASSAQLHRWGNVIDGGRPDLSEADMIIFLGDFNYRLYGISYDEARDLVSQRCFDWLREKDQLRAEMRAGKVFQGFREGQIIFPPTYKFQRNQPGLAGYDSSEKKRIPAWCDRILYRDNRSISSSDCSLECPIVSSVMRYEACIDVTDSDHKPVRCLFSVDIARLDEFTRRKLYGEIIAYNEKITSLLDEYRDVPETTVSTTNIILGNQDSSILKITNKCQKHKAVFEILCERICDANEDDQCSKIRSKGSFGFPIWLKVSPAVGMINANNTIELSIQHENLRTLEDYMDDAPKNQWTEDTLDSEVILIIMVTGIHSTESRTHLINVRRTFKSCIISCDSNHNL